VSPAGRSRVLFIGGVGRSGSTVLERVLDQLDGVAAVGEVCHLLERGVVEDQLCGCGAPFSACPLWSRVGEIAFGGWGSLDVDGLLAAKAATDRTRFVPRLLAGRSGPTRAYTGFLDAVYRAVSEATGAEVVVDSSKHLSTAAVLAAMDGVDLAVVHLVRDARGVAYSWTKQVRRPEVTDRTLFMPSYHPSRPALRWMTDNAGFELLARRGTPTLRLRYEEAMTDLRRHVERIAALAGLDASGRLGFLGERSVRLLGPTHSVAGNPMRFDQGEVPLRLDAEWQRSLPFGQLATVSAITAPLLAYYGYPLRRTAR
jgi:hypothetical protein